MAALVQQRSVPAYSPTATKYTPNLALHKSTPAAKETPSTTTPSSSSITTTEDITNDIRLLAETLDIHVTHLISSPYPDPENQLALPTLPLPSRLFALALTHLTPTRPDYATAPYLESFNWPSVFALLRALSQKHEISWPRTEFYVVIFRSKLKEVIDRERLGLLDQKSHQEACASGGLLKYWFGAPDGGRRNLATCLWHSHADAVAGGAGPWHRQARLAAREMYERIDFHVHKLVVEEGVAGWALEDFQRS